MKNKLKIVTAFFSTCLILAATAAFSQDSLNRKANSQLKQGTKEIGHGTSTTAKGVGNKTKAGAKSVSKETKKAVHNVKNDMKKDTLK